MLIWIEIFIFTNVCIEMLENDVLRTLALGICLFTVLVFISTENCWGFVFESISLFKCFVEFRKRFNFAQMVDKMNVTLDLRQQRCDLIYEIQALVLQSCLFIFDNRVEFLWYFVNRFEMSIVVDLLNTFFDLWVCIVYLIDIFLHLFEVSFHVVVSLEDLGVGKGSTLEVWVDF